jgi:hypothetical protein
MLFSFFLVFLKASSNKVEACSVSGAHLQNLREFREKNEYALVTWRQIRVRRGTRHSLFLLRRFITVSK